MTQQEAIKRLAKWGGETGMGDLIGAGIASWAANFYADTRARITAAELIADREDRLDAKTMVSWASDVTHTLIADMTGGSDE